MNPYFVASIIREGVLGGGISTDEEKMTYHTNKLTVSPELKRIEMRYADIIEIGFQRRFLFPVFSILLKDNRKYRFIVFGSKRFRSFLKERVKTAAMDV